MKATTFNGLFFICFIQLVTSGVVVFSATLPVFAEPQASVNIRLVLQITIDGLRADLIKRYEKGFGNL